MSDSQINSKRNNEIGRRDFLRIAGGVVGFTTALVLKTEMQAQAQEKKEQMEEMKDMKILVNSKGGKMQIMTPFGEKLNYEVSPPLEGYSAKGGIYIVDFPMLGKTTQDTGGNQMGIKMHYGDTEYYVNGLLGLKTLDNRVDPEVSAFHGKPYSSSDNDDDGIADQIKHPQGLGQSHGCFRMHEADIMNLINRVQRIQQHNQQVESGTVENYTFTNEKGVTKTWNGKKTVNIFIHVN